MLPLTDLPSKCDTPIDLWNAQASFKAAVESRTTMVFVKQADGVPTCLSDVFLQDCDNLKHLAEIQKLPSEKVAGEAKTAATALQGY